MKKFVLSGLACAGLVVLLPETGYAHGGQYRGPGDTVPPGGGSGGGGHTGGPSGPTTGGPSGPSAPSPTGPTTGGGGPSTGGPSGPGGPGGPRTGGGRGYQVEDDLTNWSFWWEFNKDPFIRLREAVQASGPVTGSDDFYIGSTRRADAKDSLRPTAEQINNVVLPSLKKALDSTEQRDMTSSCMVAMAKIGVNHADFKLIDIFKPRLRKPDQEIRETAALAIGIAAIAGETEVDLLLGLAQDNDKGREAFGGAVDNRTRSFATYGLGLLAHREAKTELKSRVFQALKAMLADKKVGDRNIKVAVINAIGLLNVGTSTEEDKNLLKDAVLCLEDYYMEALGAGEQIIQAHCPTAIAKLIGRDHEMTDHFKDRFADDLQEKGKVKRSSNQIFQSCAMALGLLAHPNEDKDDKKNPDAKISKLLVDTFHDHKDQQTRFFAALALGLMGGQQNRDLLLKEFEKAKSQEKPWVALSLGVYSFFRYEQQKKATNSFEPERKVAEALIDALKQNKNPETIGALAIALGLSQSTDAADQMREMMLASVAQESVCGYLCIGLALMNDTRSLESIRQLLPQSVRRYELLPQAAIALGKLGDKRVADDLQKLMTDGEPNLAKLSAIAAALGFIGDSRTIDPLRKMLFDDKLGDLSRAFSAVALGGVADKEPLPWNSKIGVNMNYRAAVETLTNQNTGILDIL